MKKVTRIMPDIFWVGFKKLPPPENFSKGGCGIAIRIRITET
jgi:hypothetical protein